MASRRSHGEGSIYRTPDGKRWVAQLDLGYDETGKRRRPKRIVKTRQEAQSALRKLRRDNEEGRRVATRPRARRVSDWLTLWLEGEINQRHEAGELAVSTVKNYERVVRLHLKPRIGGIRIEDLQASHIWTLYARLAADGMSQGSIHEVHRVLRAALNAAVNDDLIPASPMRKVKSPKLDPGNTRFLTLPEIKQLLAAVKGHRDEALITVLALCGLRVGEALGLRWSDVDLEQRTLNVVHQLQRHGGEPRLVAPKSKESRRTIALPEQVIGPLKRHRTKQRKRKLADLYWEDNDFVFAVAHGRPDDPSNLHRRWTKIRASVGMPDLRLHDLRHTAGSLAVIEGTPMKVVQGFMGHSDYRLTANTYSHIPEIAQRDLAARIDAALEA